LDHTDGSGDERWNLITKDRQVVVSGIYVAYFEVTKDIENTATGDLIFKKGDSTFKKFIVIR